MIMIWILGACTIFGGIAALCYFWDKIAAWCSGAPKTLPELPLDIEMARQLGLETALEKEGYRLFLSNVTDVEKRIYFGDYEQILWPNKEGKLSRVVAPVGCDSALLKTKYKPEEIQKRKEERESSNK